jgi:hypothetical protein
LWGRIGVSSQTDGPTALTRIAAAGPSFAIVNGLFHLGALLLLPGAVALVIALRGESADPWLLLGMPFALLAVAVGAGLVFALNHGLAAMAAASGAAGESAGAAAEMNLKVQAGAELVQSTGLGLWLITVSVAAALSGWPDWIAWLGAAGGIGFILAGLSSVLWGVAVVGPTLGAIGALGLVLFVVWDLAVGLRLLTTQG